MRAVLPAATPLPTWVVPALAALLGWAVLLALLVVLLVVAEASAFLVLAVALLPAASALLAWVSVAVQGLGMASDYPTLALAVALEHSKALGFLAWALAFVLLPAASARPVWVSPVVLVQEMSSDSPAWALASVQVPWPVTVLEKALGSLVLVLAAALEHSEPLGSLACALVSVLAPLPVLVQEMVSDSLAWVLAVALEHS